MPVYMTLGFSQSERANRNRAREIGIRQGSSSNQDNTILIIILKLYCL